MQVFYDLFVGKKLAGDPDDAALADTIRMIQDHGQRKKYYHDEDAMIMWVHDIDGSEFASRIAEITESLR